MMLSEKIKKDIVKISALFDFYEELANQKLKDRQDLKNTKEKMMFVRKQIIDLTSNVKSNVKQFEDNL